MTNCIVGLPGGSRDYVAEGEECNMHDAISIASPRWMPAIKHESIGLETSNVDR